MSCRRCWSHVQQVLHRPLCILQLQSSVLDRVLGLKGMSQAVRQSAMGPRASTAAKALRGTVPPSINIKVLSTGCNSLLFVMSSHELELPKLFRVFHGQGGLGWLGTCDHAFGCVALKADQMGIKFFGPVARGLARRQEAWPDSRIEGLLARLIVCTHLRSTSTRSTSRLIQLVLDVYRFSDRLADSQCYAVPLCRGSDFIAMWSPHPSPSCYLGPHVVDELGSQVKQMCWISLFPATCPTFAKTAATEGLGLGWGQQCSPDPAKPVSWMPTAAESADGV
ncbi:unnamed protein product [Symbiodinium sp. KB8]|nr:unnamed protein product [Symbiodinium sp. KB8]